MNRLQYLIESIDLISSAILDNDLSGDRIDQMARRLARYTEEYLDLVGRTTVKTHLLRGLK